MGKQVLKNTGKGIVVGVSGRGRLVSGKESRQETRHDDMESISCEEEFPYCERETALQRSCPTCQ